MRVIGLGTQDSLGEAEQFVADRGTTFTMLWDESFESWAALNVTAQPTAILFAADPANSFMTGQCLAVDGGLQAL